KGGGSNLAFSPDGHLLAASGAGQVTVWDAATGREIRTLKGGGSNLAFSPDGHLLAASSRGEGRGWGAATGPGIRTLTQLGRRRAFSSEGHRRASAGWAQGGTTVKVWDAATGQQILTVAGLADSSSHAPLGSPFGLSPNGHRLACGSGSMVKI